MLTLPKLTIGIPSYNSAPALAQCLNSIQTEISDLEPQVIVVDDASTDDTTEQVKRDFPMVEIITHHQNKGVAISTQEILARMKGEYLLRLDADTMINRPAVIHLLTEMEENTQIGVLAPKLVDKNDNFQASFEDHFLQPYEWFSHYFLWGRKILQRFSSSANSDREEPFPVAFLASAAVLVRRKATEDVGGLDPSMEFFMEDTDWVWRIHQAGWQVIYDPRVSIIHIGGSSGELYIHTRDRSLKNLYYFYAKHQPGSVTQIALALSILAGSVLSLVCAFLFLPIAQLQPHWWKVERIALKSFMNVFVWHFRHIINSK